MFDLPLDKTVFIVCIVAYTLATAWTDLRLRKIYNKVTVPMWLAGWVYQGVFHQWDGMLNGLCGFGVGFGLLFVLWMIGTAGGGDVKLLGGLSVWLGAGLTFKVVFASLIIVVLGTFGVLVAGVCKRGWRKTRDRYRRKKTPGSRKAVRETNAQLSERRVMAFAMPVALATWSVLLLFQNQW
ncbi:MAG: A24 family peptidase [Fuerstiella sp.]